MAIDVYEDFDFIYCFQGWLMKRLLPLILLCNVASADVTSSGATTNTQTNNAGSNTAITGGYESSTTYQSGSS